MVTMQDYIYEEKEVLSTILKKNDFSTRKQMKKTTNLLMLATGSSYNACLAAKPALESYGELTVDIQEPFHFAHYGKFSPSIDTVIAVSQSGKSASTVEAVKMIQKQEIPIIAVTNDVQSPLALEATQIIDLGAGIETVGFVTKGYSATVLQLLLLGLGIGISKNNISKEIEQNYMQQLQKIIDHLPVIIQKTEEFFDEYQSLFRLTQRFITIGYGPNWGTAKEAETKLTETIRVPSQGFELEAYMHGPYLEADASHLLFFIEGDNENKERSQKLRRYMSQYVGEALTITTKKARDEKTLGLAIECDEYLSILALVVPFQLFAYKIAAAKGIDLNKKIFEDFDTVLKSKL
ncbi:SIS domain-containing protein [Enterococcus sp. DIV0802]|uniref:SIS domain-containing protein n=1 Tax=unclassified Enterococcus TaxID=2608891 RepID=UPI003F1F949C